MSRPVEQRTQSRAKLSLVFALIAILLGSLVPVAAYVFRWPASDTDAVSFVVPAINYAQGRGLVSTHWLAADVTDPTGQRRFTYHGPLFPIALSWLMPTADVQGARFALTAIRVVTVALFGTLLVLLLFKQSQIPGAIKVLVVAVLVFTVAGMRMPMIGRPEGFAELLLLVSVATWWLLGKGSAAVVAASCVIGILAAAQPSVGYLAMTTIIAWISATNGLKTSATLIASCGLTALIAFFAVLWMTPFGVHDSIQGIINAGIRDKDRLSSLMSDLPRYWLFWWDRTFFGPAFIVALPAFIALLVHRSNHNRSLVLIIPALVLLAVGLWQFGIRTGAVNYNIAAFHSLTTLFLIYASILSLRSLAPLQRTVRQQSVLAVAVSLIVAPSLLVFLKNGVEIHQMYATGHTFEEARSRFKQLTRPADIVLFSGANWTLLDEFTNAIELSDERSIDEAFKRAKNSGGRVIAVLRIVQPANPRIDPVLSRCEVIPIDRFAAGASPKLFGVAVNKFDSGYSFLAFELRQKS